MRKLKSQLNTLAILLVAALMSLVGILKALAQLPAYVYYALAITGLVWFVTWVSAKIQRRGKKYINKDGYVFLVDENDLEHRHLAKQALGRNLLKGEVVHHINGKRANNAIWNLCLMNKEKHEHFHAWLRWKREKTGRYPIFREQKRVLVSEYGGTLLEHLVPQRKPTTPVSPPTAPTVRSEQSKRLFAELRKERKRLADEMNIPAYEIFHDRTLWKISESLPESEREMLLIPGIHPQNALRYGPQFFSIIKRFRHTQKGESGGQTDSA